ncbi:MAG: HEAT repeat domain-containing protein [Elusimicrobiota bacterium]|nr:HEAT repeat domain-containing protein [Elusimicrobiota bacterium]
MKKHKTKTECARKALFAGVSHGMISAAVSGALLTAEGFLKKSRRVPFIKLFALITLFAGLVVPRGEARFLFFGKDKTSREMKADKVVKKLKGPNSAERGKAADDLIRLDKKRGVREIKTALKKEKDSGVKKNMLNVLGNSGDVEAIPDVKEHLDSEDSGVRLYAACALAKLGDDSGIDELRSVVSNANESRGRRSFAIRSLGGIKTAAAVAVLGNALEDGDFAIRLQAVVSLGKIGSVKALNAVKKMTGDEDEGVRRAAENILMRVGK